MQENQEQQEQEVVDTQETTAEETKSALSEDGVYRVDLRQQTEQQETITDTQPEEKQPQEEQEVPVLQEVVEEEEQPAEQENVETSVKEVQEDVTKEEEVKESSIDLPEGVQSLVEFINETGGTIEDYARLNADYSNVDDKALLLEYYKSAKPHLTIDEINFIIEDKFTYDEDVDEERDIKRKQLAYKEEVAQARHHLEGLKSQYYQELKLGSRLTKEQQKAVDFFNRYNNEQTQAQELSAKQQQHYENETNKVFNDKFKGFDFNVGDKKYRFNVKDVQETKTAQSNVLNVFDKFIGKDNLLQDAKGYHKSLFAARNADAIANHFYEQGKADAVKNMSAQAKNISVDNRPTPGTVETRGQQFKVVSGENSSNTKLKLKNY